MIVFCFFVILCSKPCFRFLFDSQCRVKSLAWPHTSLNPPQCFKIWPTSCASLSPSNTCNSQCTINQGSKFPQCFTIWPTSCTSLSPLDTCNSQCTINQGSKFPQCFKNWPTSCASLHLQTPATVSAPVIRTQSSPSGPGGHGHWKPEALPLPLVY